jgi:hypothetical protein
MILEEKRSSETKMIPAMRWGVQLLREDEELANVQEPLGGAQRWGFRHYYHDHGAGAEDSVQRGFGSASPPDSGFPLLCSQLRFRGHLLEQPPSPHPGCPPYLWRGIVGEFARFFWLSLIPFITQWVGDTNFAEWPVAVYGIVLFMAGFAYWVLVRVLLRHE